LRYPELDLDLMNRLNPDLILLSSEPYPFKEKHLEELEKSLGIGGLLVDGETFSWYGSRQAKSIQYLRKFTAFNRP
jgi:hypothetical protein